jgi:hypothetical protein
MAVWQARATSDTGGDAMTRRRIWLTSAAVVGVGAGVMAAGLMWLVWFVLTQPAALTTTVGGIR